MAEDTVTEAAPSGKNRGGGARKGRRSYHRLTPTEVRDAVESGRYPDGAGLYLHVGPTGGRSWVLRVQHQGISREIGLGPLHTVTLPQARKLAQQARFKLLEGKDPIKERAAERATNAAACTFKVATERYVTAHQAGWTNLKYARQWPQSLIDHAFPVIGEFKVREIELGHITKVLERDNLWRAHTRLASDLRSRIEAVLDFATVKGWRTGDNPARWKGHLEHALPAPGKIHTVKPHAALPYAELPVFMRLLHLKEGDFARALEFDILTCARSGSVQQATWEQIALDPMFGWTWNVPATGMKGRIAFRIPLSTAAVRVLERQGGGAIQTGPGLIFRNAVGKRLHDLGPVLEQLGYGQYTPHGMRSAYRTWASENGLVRRYSREEVELVLSHKLGDKAEQSYARSESLVARRGIMEEWAGHCLPKPDLQVIGA